MQSTRTHDVVVFGATGFTGRLVAEYLTKRLAGTPVRWALAGRSRARLETVRTALAEIDSSAERIGIVEASVEDPASLARMAASTRVVLSTVGPYAQYGEPVVSACIDAGTDYVDITGEPAFVDRMLTAYDAKARAKGVRIVNCCGFDSIPHDLGAYFTVKQFPAGTPIRLEGFVRANGTFSGGTWHSALGAMAGLKSVRAVQRRTERSTPDGRRVRGIRPKIRFEPRVKSYVCPMPTIDPQVVLRSARTLPEYGPDFTYGHYAQVRSPFVLAGGLVAVGTVALLAQVPPVRTLLGRVRAPGEGPSDTQRAKGWFKVTFIAEGNGRTVTTQVSGGDPGYSETAKMVAESALCLALDRDRLPLRTGVLTTAEAMAELLLDRLVANGIRFEVLGDATSS